MSRSVTDSELRGAFPLVSLIEFQLRTRGQVAAHVDRDDLIAVGREAAWRALGRAEGMGPQPGRHRGLVEPADVREPQTLAEVGRRLGVTESRACQMAAEARRRIRPAA